MKVVYLDLETTGFSRQWDYIIEIAAILYDMKKDIIVDEFHEYIKPGKTIPAKITELTGITNAQVRFARTEYEVLMSLQEWLHVNKPDKVIGHNYKSFDGSFLKTKCENYRIPQFQFKEEIDTLTIARKVLPKPIVENHKQTTLAKHFGIEYTAHSAIEDVKALIQIHKKLTQNKEKVTREDLGF